MANRRGPWEDGRRAWARLTAQYGGAAHGPATGEEALDALTDVSGLRRLLDQAELAAVTTARRHRKSWGEIATRLGVTRQSAWERWREVDEDKRVEANVLGHSHGVSRPKSLASAEPDQRESDV